ncbi:Retrovirus-related Pol polyprotein from transposon 17.6 [Stylophora pistillata]|uniref:Retrovirus-related Pol polyprotein from transposon 17.6 n=1 Tax=Stylophora pistillata TaxID=50429 RepID=A0A2B4R8L7_STYPI|nr:Retrovirus-related Pol polyprotein from transposon 17.6 [Stylophora pistillata]
MKEKLSCPAKGKKCEKCGRYGHFALCCKAQSGNYATGGKPDQRRRDSDRRQSYNVNFVGDQNASDSEENCAFAFAATENQGETCNATSLKEPVLEVNINGITTRVLIDSGVAGVCWTTKPLDYEALGLLRTSSSVSSKFLECNVVGENLAPVLQAKYPTVFVGVGGLKDYKLKVHVDSKVTPAAQKPRRVPFARREKVTAKVEDLIAKDIVERVNRLTSWVSPVVIAPKESGDIRLCVDMRKANAAIIRERIPIPTVDEVLENLNGTAVFSKLDLCLGFHQTELDEDSRDITTFAIHDGMYKVVFIGLLVSKYGIGPTEEKVRAVLESSHKTKPKEVRSFLGMAGFIARFIPNFATNAEPLRAISRQGVPFVRDSEEEASFQELKQQLAKAPVLAYFDKEAHTRVIADASPVGLGAVLVQEKNGVDRAICYASRSLSSVERRYSQTEKEALALVWTCEWFNQYLNGLQTFDLVTDHEALKVIYSRGSKPSARIERWVLRLQPYSYKVCCVASRDNIADALSRLTTLEASEKFRYDDAHVQMVALKAVPVAVKVHEIESASAEDEELQAVHNCLVRGNWEKGPRSFLMVRNEFTFIGQVILRGTRIVIRKVLR